ncbi:MAG: hypothetical protein N2746_05740 [Deltaproteobacteria bacterium]|nr:hypothetical protein [Deltaproteobacteria bacterium]
MDIGCCCVYLSEMIVSRKPRGVFVLKNDKGVDKNMRGILEVSKRCLDPLSVDKKDIMP